MEHQDNQQPIQPYEGESESIAEQPSFPVADDKAQEDCPCPESCSEQDVPAIEQEKGEEPLPVLEAGSEAWFEADRVAFDAAYPDVDKAALFASDEFLDYAEGKVGRIPLAEVYRGYCRLLDKLQTARRVQAARDAAPGSLRQVAQDAEGEFFTLKQMQNMSPAYIEAHWDKVQRSIKNLSTKQA